MKASWVGLCLALAVGPALAQERVDLYPGARNVSLAPGLVAAGERFEASYFQSADPPEQVTRFYVRRWEAAGYPVTVESPVDAAGDGARVVAAFQTREARQLAVILRPWGTGTLGFRVERALPRKAGPPPRGPTGEGGGLSVAAGTEGGPARIHVSAGSPVDVWRQRVLFWERAGFVRRSGEPGAARTQLTQGPEGVTLVIAPLPPGRVVVLEERWGEAGVSGAGAAP